MRATTSNIEESTAALGRAPQLVPGLTEFLRREYYRRMGIYLNGSLKEHGCLLNFWKDHVSETYKNLNEQKKAQQRQENMMKTMQKMNQLEKTDPAQYRRIMLEKEEKRLAKERKAEREMKIAAAATMKGGTMRKVSND